MLKLLANAAEVQVDAAECKQRGRADKLRTVKLSPKAKPGTVHVVSTANLWDTL